MKVFIVYNFIFLRPDNGCWLRDFSSTFKRRNFLQIELVPIQNLAFRVLVNHVYDNVWESDYFFYSISVNSTDTTEWWIQHDSKQIFFFKPRIA